MQFWIFGQLASNFFGIGGLGRNAPGLREMGAFLDTLANLFFTSRLQPRMELRQDLPFELQRLGDAVGHRFGGQAQLPFEVRECRVRDATVIRYLPLRQAERHAMVLDHLTVLIGLRCHLFAEYRLARVFARAPLRPLAGIVDAPGLQLIPPAKKRRPFRVAGGS